jgi:iron complex outermembrane receptor protein
MKAPSRALIGALVISLSPIGAFAQTRPADLGLVPIEDLMNIQITSLSHKEQRAGDVAAAVFVITHETIRRSGMTTVPELLRLVPGAQVAQINSNKWAVAVRGFNDLFTDKLLVLIDGRTVYDRLNSGVFWESIDVPLDDIDRIEVIRGAGGATWGANAVNGVINIVTKAAADGQGASVAVSGGTFDGTHASARYGGMLGGVAYRLSSKWSGHGESRLDGQAAGDRWQSQNHTFRLDWDKAADALMMEGGAALANLNGLWHAPTGPVPAIKPPFSELQGEDQYHVLGRWTHTRADGSSLQVQSFFDFLHNTDTVNPTQRMTDVEAQYHTSLGARHDVVAGAGYRFLSLDVPGGIVLSITPNAVAETVVNAFAEDEIALARRVRLTLGSKIERTSLAGWGLQPTARVMWSLVPTQHVWASVSRALRTPALTDTRSRFNYASFIGQGGMPVVVGAIGNPAFQSEEVVDTEGGYRLGLGQTASVDATLFRSAYSRLKTSEPLTPQLELTPAPRHLFVPVQFGNGLNATATGFELSAQWAPATWWHLDGGYSTFHLTPRLAEASGDTAAASFDGHAPRAQWHSHSSFCFGSRAQVDASLFHVGALPALGIDAYTRADARLELPLRRDLSLAVVGQNLFDSTHAEYAGFGAIVTPTLVPRSARVQLQWHVK